MAGSATLGVIMVGVAAFVGFEGLKHFQGTAANASGAASNPTGPPSYGPNAVVLPQSTGSAIADAKSFAAVNGIAAAPILAIAQFESQMNPNATNLDCKGNGSYDTVCKGYLQVNTSVYGQPPGSLLGELAIPGIGDRIVATIKKYGNNWQQNFLQFWAEAQGGTSNGNPSDVQRAQQAVAYGLQNG